MSVEPEYLLAIYLFLIGSAVGSFLNVVIYRLPRGESIVKPRSHCPHCDTPIKPYDNIPILSWLLVRGKCRNCKERISIRYPAVELTTALWFVWMYLQFGLSWEFAQYLTLGIILLAISMVDLDTKLIPDSVLLVGGVSALIFAIMGNVISLKGSLMGGAVMGGVLLTIALIGEFVFKKESMGFGDVKLSVMIGLFIGWEMALLAIFLSAIFASVISIGGLLMGRMKFGKPFAFGPFLALGAIVSGIWGEGILLAYLKWALG